MFQQLALNIDALNALYINNNLFINTYLEQERIKQFKEYNIDPFAIAHDESSEESALTLSLNNYYRNTSIETELVLSNYMIVACFSYYEKTLKEILKSTNKFSEDDLRHCYQVNQLSKLLKAKFGINYNNLIYSMEINELRYLNNTIKHSGVVDDKLTACNSKWNKGYIVKNTFEDFKRLSPLLMSNLKDLVTKIKDCITND